MQTRKPEARGRLELCTVVVVSHGDSLAPASWLLMSLWERVYGASAKQQTYFQVTAIMSNTESVVLETSVGDIQLELYWDHAPKVCISIINAAMLS